MARAGREVSEGRGWEPPSDWPRVRTVDAHTEGEPFRVVVSGLPDVPGGTMLERRRWARQHLDHLRTGLMWEPRGHADMYGCILTPPVSGEADFGVLFLHNEGFSTMCGHGIIGVTTVAVATGMLPATEPETTVRIDTPAGLVVSKAAVRDGRVREVKFQNVPSFALALDQEAQVPGLGRIGFDVGYGGAFYAYVRAADLGLGCRPADFRGLVEAAARIKPAVAESCPIHHPFEPDLSFLYGVVFVGPAEASGAHSRNVCVFADGEVDRSPTGTSVSARLAIHYARGEVALDQEIAIESILGTRFTGRVVEATTFGPHHAVIPEVGGTAYVTGRHEFLFDPADPLRDGFILR